MWFVWYLTTATSTKTSNSPGMCRQKKRHIVCRNFDWHEAGAVVEGKVLFYFNLKRCVECAAAVEECPQHDM